jgi:hypothetical protein
MTNLWWQSVDPHSNPGREPSGEAITPSRSTGSGTGPRTATQVLRKRNPRYKKPARKTTPVWLEMLRGRRSA